jgi:hypothetical protein
MSDELVTVATFMTVQEAVMARGFLEANGVGVFMADEAMSRIASYLIPMTGGIRLQVRREDAETARELLADVESDPGFR